VLIRKLKLNYPHDKNIFAKKDKITRADVVIIGGGIIGCSVAYYLSQKGVKVILVEKNQLCSGASGSNQGGATFARTIDSTRELSLMSLQLYKDIKDKLDFDIEFEEVKYCICSLNNSDDALLKTYKKLKEKDVKCNLFGKSKIEKMDLPFISYSTVKSMIEILKGCYMVNPFKVTFGLAQAAIKNGANIQLNTEVKEININRNGRIETVVTTKGKIRTKYVVNAAGAWSGNIGEMVGVDIPITPCQGQIIVTEPNDISNYRYFLDVDYLKNEYYHINSNNLPERGKLGVATVLAQHKSGNWTIGSSREFVGLNKKTTIKTINLIAKRAAQYFPSIRSIYSIRTFAGVRPFCYKDGYPIIGKINKIKGFIIASGHGGSGIKFGPVTGKIITQIIISGESPILPDALKYSRFSIKSS